MYLFVADKYSANIEIPYLIKPDFCGRFNKSHRMTIR
jgi:hypothetical protein